MPFIAKKRQGQGQGDADVPFPGSKPEVFTLDRFEGLNTQASRPGIDDQENSWLENMIPIGASNLRSLYGEGANIWTPPGGGVTAISIFPYNIGTVPQMLVFRSDGGLDNINLNTLVQQNIALANTFYDGTAIPACAQWGNSGVVIVSKLSSTNNGYWAWDGQLWPPGNASSPVWLGGGLTTAMPTSINGTYVETYQSRVIIDSGNIKQVSGPANGTTFSSAGGGVTLTASDPFLKRAFIASKQANGFLYSFGDSSINVISNITAGTPATLSNQNVDPQVGTSWKGTVQVFGNSIIFANTSGVYELRGGSAVKISDKIDGIFASAALTQPITTQPIAAVATLFGIRCYMLLLSVLDPFTNSQRFLLCMWNGKKWFLGSQVLAGLPLTTIATQEIDSNLVAWGTSGSNVVQLFKTATDQLIKTIQSKFIQGDGGFITIKQILRAYALITNNGATPFSGNIKVETLSDTGAGSTNLPLTSSTQLLFVNNQAKVINFRNSSSLTIIFVVIAVQIFGVDAQGPAGGLIGFTITSSTGATDFTVVSLKFEYQKLAPIGG